MLISVCILAKDAEKTIAKALETAQLLGDEIIVRMDRSSSDATREIVDDYFFNRPGVPMKVVEYDFIDFGSARNGLVHEAEGEWIFMLDADETLDPEDVKVIRQWLLTAPEKLIYCFPRRNWDDFGRSSYRTDHYPDYQFRLFPNDGVVNYGEQRVHEMPQGQPIKRCPHSHVHINHFCFAIRTHEDWHRVNHFYKDLRERE